MTMLWIALVFMLSVSSVWAASCEQYPVGSGHWYPGSYAAQTLLQADVAQCVTSASANATIHLPTATETWSGGITINKAGLKFVGQTTGCPDACVDHTIISSGNAQVFSPQSNNWQISGITFQGGSQTYGIIWANTPGAVASSGWRIHHNNFINFTGRAITVGAGVSAGSTYAPDYPGLIDNNRFYSAQRRKCVEVYGHSMSAHGSWDDPLGLGGPDWTFVEDNIMDFDTLVDGTADAFDTDYNGKVVVRFNRFRNGGTSAHGVEDCNTFSAHPCASRSVRGLEIYGNTFTFSVFSSFVVNIRGGTGVVWGNTVSGTQTGYVPWRYLYERGDYTGRCTGKCQGENPADGNQTGTYGYVCYQQPGTTGPTGIAPFPFYQWLNTGFGSTSEAANTTATYSASCNYQHVLVGRDIKLVERSSVGTSLPATCAVGDGYWKTNEGYWNSKNDTPTRTADGVLYKCTATNTWTLSYVPHPYPHPLQSGLGAPSLQVGP